MATPEKKTNRTLLLRLRVHKVPRVADNTQSHLDPRQWSGLILDWFNPSERPIDLDERYVPRLVLSISQPTFWSSDSLPGTKLHRIVFTVRDRLLTVIANVRLDMRQPSELMRPVIGAMARGHNRVVADEPTRSHCPRCFRVLASEAKKQFHNGLMSD